MSSDFSYLREFLKKRSGLVVPEEKDYLLESRLQSVMRQGDYSTIAELVKCLKGNESSLLGRNVVEAMTTNESFFFRDKKPFEQFENIIIPALMRARAHKKKIRIWCAAASSGQEPYSLAMCLDKQGSKLSDWSVDIIATDIDTKILQQAREAYYTQFEVQRGLPIQILMKHFEQEGDRWRIKQELRSRVEFEQANLLKSFLHLGSFDIVFCRNVLIYFDAETKADVLKRISRVLAPDGFLVLGSAETVLGLASTFQPLKGYSGLYCKSDAPAMDFLASA